VPTAPHLAPQIHPAHAAARNAMARRLVTHLRSTGDEMLTDPDLLAWLPKARLDAIAREAGETHTPSLDTWHVVIDLLRIPACPDCGRNLDDIAAIFGGLPS
jgi:hypothetical protein